MNSDEENISRLYQQGKKPKPSAGIDDSILSAARDALRDDDIQHNVILHRKQAKKITARKTPLFASPFSGGWRAPASIAAILVLTVILVPLLQQQEQQPSIPSFSDDEAVLMKQNSIMKLNAEKENGQATALTTKRKQVDVLQQQQMQQSAQPSAENMQTRSFAKPLVNEEKTAAARVKVAAPETELSPSHKAQSAPVAANAASLNAKTPIASTAMKQQNRLMPVADDAQRTIMPAKKWLQKIQQLIARGDIQLAQDEFDAFTLHYPDEDVDPLISRELKVAPY